MKLDNLLCKEVKVNAHAEDIAFGGRGRIARQLSEELSRAIYENMTVSPIGDSMFTVGITVYIQDNREEWKDYKQFTEVYKVVDDE